MCGLAGYIQRKFDDAGLIEGMTARLAHRGPDGEGHWRSALGGWRIALGHRRLAILDVKGGAQPMATADGSSCIAYNGEVYNHHELRRSLGIRGRLFTSRSDTETVLHHLDDNGQTEGTRLAALNGMFAIALWDSRRGRLLLARDRAGIKPLYYAPLPDGGVAFASELRALCGHPGVARAIDPESLAAYFFLDYPVAPRTMLRGARQLAPASYMTWRAGALSSERRYWVLPVANDAAASDRHAASNLRACLDSAVHQQLLSDVPVGILLSGGLDSSLVAALTRRHSQGSLKTFTIGFDDPSFDEGSFAGAVASHLHAEHIEERLTEASALAVLDDALNCLDQPIADPSIVPTFLLARLASRHVKVVLSGDGGDELWAGYPSYKAHRWARLYRAVPRAARSALVKPFVRALPVSERYHSCEWRAKRFVLRWDDQPVLRHLRWMSNLDIADLATALPGSPALLANLVDTVGRGLTGDELDVAMRLDFSTYLPGSVLAKIDRAAMAHGLEVRPPLLANQCIDFAFGLPSAAKMRGFQTKSLLKNAARDLLPAYIIHRRKHGFAMPLAAWLRGALRERLDACFDPGPLWETGWLCRDAFLRFRDQHERSQVDRSRSLWALLVLHHWHDRLC